MLGGSWGSTLALAYAEAHPGAVSEIVLFFVATTTAPGGRVDHARRRPVLPGRVAALPLRRARRRARRSRRGLQPAAARSEPAVHERAAREWCRWEDTQVRTRPDDPPDPRFADPAFRLCFARLVTHYWRHAAWLDEDALLRGARGLAGIPGVLIHGRLDLGSPLDVPWRLAEAWPGSELVVVEGEGHHGGSGMTDALVAATRRFAGGE